jgi:hypothetical protein
MRDNPDGTIDECRKHLRANRIQVSIKDPWVPNSTTTTAYPKDLRLASNWHEYTELHKAITLIHEVTHYNDRKHVRRWWRKYTTSPWNLVIFECRAYFAGILAKAEMLRHTCSYERFKDDVDDLVEHLPEVYFPTRVLNKRKLRRVVHKAARKALG